MRKEIAPELYNYNKFPGPEFHINGDKVETEGIAFTLVENIKDAFDVTVFNQRFSEVLTKFDYVVGDWSNEQLRLRGFYKDDRTEKKNEKISRLQDYLLEYCSYGCAYFVLENQVPKRASFDKKMRKKEEEKLPRRDKKSFQNKRKPNTNKRNKHGQKEQKSQKEDKGRRHFVIRQK
ncbi:YutD family protein [Streptococcus oralis]|uniref:Transcriptional regulator n=1 Tax=Streptococcus oralis TaxID=1303 RepID=A0A139PEX6_STROR|nr:YutD family protein [Streptococcus oralis]KXT87552.1 hypothetical protein SORDD16_00684 [Streptococcus oralis]